MAVGKYLAFAAFIIFAGTGIAIGYTGGSLLVGYVAYLSPWLPGWLWILVAAILTGGVAVTAISTAGAIATLAPNFRAFKICLSLLLLLVSLELSITTLVHHRHLMLYEALQLYMGRAMNATTVGYGSNISDTQLWDEIQEEMNCCGVADYKDWFTTSFGNGTDVPDSCCLLVMDDCGKDVASKVDPSDDIITEGCLPVISGAISKDYYTLGKGVWVPVCTMHIALLVLLVAASMFMQEGHMARNLYIFSVSAVKLNSEDGKYCLLNDKLGEA
ncbi:tetraspanin-36-like isoform X2 [Oratosquilla oratoria]|uniref:tetraspanin-36-like isoform X2 n=1 Tax=Oratosquilla oratoria TaxID=337810 RepID=UPI003F77734C